MATILLAYAVARLIEFPGFTSALEIGGIVLPVQIDAQAIVSIAVAGMAATGMDWLLRQHTSFAQTSTLEHWLLPALTAWGLSVALAAIPLGGIWWLALLIAGGLLSFVMLAEYVVIDPEDTRYPLATIALTALSFVLFLIVAIALGSFPIRLLLLLPAVGVAAGSVSLRVLRLRIQDGWRTFESLAILLIAAQIAATLHYLPGSPISFGLIVLGPVYALCNLAANLALGQTARESLPEPVFVLGSLWALALWMW